MIQVNNLNKYFGEKHVLKDISITYKPGECSLIIGASGSGKTVFLKSLVGLLTPDSGEIWYEKIQFNALSFKEQRSIRKEIGMLFQGSALFDFATVEENVRFPMDFFTTWSDKEKLDRVNFCLERVNLKNVNKLFPNELSGGMQKRVGIARAIALNPKYLFCDEPNSGLDPHTSILIDQLISEITKEYNITTVVNTHDMNSVMEIGDTVGFIHQGKLVWEGDKENVLTSDCEELNNFVFASRMAKKMKEMMG
ncbi:MAG: ABC transporter ATP-binding protein [Bacteroidetes bacterium GWE2_39_28]|nr:MAG: ABC transporter ATP-binding protein [Bacteroidetes bacterium GWE2_39_28]OFY14810.1 MAG: ABC transporter ATP-binding protein [Bacteroidetes bacterium GWF2_39_10]OFZ07861.1 MAG: ABC transporter ATP-binding protein [Bacteroidetes bacterium RIFOXYB2_FULL_39_7]OFZ12094.1 MAG: ABC transporter ATP-binding protein [Bacteroidetes bacterium RIFOXYC2_FULL_39_11]HCT93263.1 ABC transporter ATP-binding protein [Rikenellaceae bacterium]